MSVSMIHIYRAKADHRVKVIVIRQDDGIVWYKGELRGDLATSMEETDFRYEFEPCGLLTGVRRWKQR